MDATSVGEIGLDLVVNQKQFNKQMAGVNSLAKKAGVALAAAFSVKKLVDFGKSCLDLGSDLNEVQNVVDTAFPNMSGQIDKFAKNAATQFGLSETMSKRYAGTFGSMAKAFGFTEAAAADMSTTLTGLAGDVASFYNISQDEAYTKLKSVFTGETESLKDLGVVMTQSALDAYALANGFGKTTKSMSEAEKVALRYQFVQSKLADAQGDFARTADGWANQVRILKLQFESLKATIGQGLINLFTPIIKAVNTLLGKLSSLANAFKSFTEMIMGKKSAASAASEISGVASSADTAASSVGSVGDAATDTAKKVKAAARALMGFDQINKVSDNNSDSSSGGSGSGGSVGGGTIDTGILSQETILDVYEKKASALTERVKELAELFKNGFDIGFGDNTKELDNIKSNLENIGKNLKNIFADEEVVKAANGLFDSIAENAGKVAGSIASLGVTIVSNLTGGISEYLDKSKNFIKERLVSMFDISVEINDLIGDFVAAFADVFSIFSGENATSCTSSLIGIFSDGFLGISDLALRFGRDVIELITKPFVENKDKIKETIDNTLGPINDVLDTLHESVKNTFEAISRVCDEHLAPMFESLSEGFSDIVGELTDGYNKHIAPVLDLLSETFDKVWKESVQPALDNIIQLFGKFADLVKTVWETTLEPFFSWLSKTIMPELAPVLKSIGNAFLDAFGGIADTISGLSKSLEALVDFITGVFSSDWEKAWSGIKDIFIGIFNQIKDYLNIPDIDVKATIKAVKDKYFDDIVDAYNKIKDRTAKLVAEVKEKTSGALSAMRSKWEDIKTKSAMLTTSLKDNAGKKLTSLKKTWESFKSKAVTLTAKFKDVFTSPLKKVWNAIASKINSAIVTINKLPGINISGRVPKLAQGGYVKKNTPQLAMIGDNRHQGEVVAPEDKLTEMARKAASMAGGGTSPEVIALLKEILAILKTLDLNVYLDGVLIKKRVVDLINANTNATGVCEIDI